MVSLICTPWVNEVVTIKGPALPAERKGTMWTSAKSTVNVRVPPIEPRKTSFWVIFSSQLEKDYPTQKLQFYKVSKGSDENDTALAAAQLGIQQLKT